MPTNIYDLTYPEFTLLVSSWGEPGFRAKQIWQGIYKNLWNSVDEFTDIPKSIRQKLASSLVIKPLLTSSTLLSADGMTKKLLFRLADGKAIETVMMKYDPESVGRSNERGSNIRQGRRTLCISTQVGCAMGCVFCATGQMGFSRQLSKGEIIAQVMFFAKELSEIGEVLTNIVVMGMGEPFHNYDNTLGAVDQLNDPEGFNFGARRFTISTVGLIPAIRRFTEEKRQVNLAISLHSADNVLRAQMLPISKTYQIDELLQACSIYTATTGRRITIEWALVNGVNDTPEQAILLAKKLKGLLCHVNAIPLNPTNGYAGIATTKERAKEFKEILLQAGIPCTVRLRRGIDIQAGCGQLAHQNKE